MSVVQLLVSQKRLILTTAVLLALFGLHSWFNMNRQEDPFFPYRHGFVLTQYPGADVNRIELQVLKPIEEELAQIEEINELTSVVRAGFAQTIIEMHEHIYDTDMVWDKVRRAVNRAQLKFPEGVMVPTVEDRLMDTASVVYTISGQTNILELRKIAKTIKNRLFNLDNVGKVVLYGMPEEQISITLDEGEIKKLNITHEFIAEQISARTSVVAINPVHVGSKRINIDAHSELDSIDEIKSTIITLADGSNLPLSAIAEVRYEPKSAASSGFWHNGKRSIALSIYIPNDILNVVDFGKSLRNYMQEIKNEYPETEIKELFFQPDRVSNRILELGRSLQTGMIFVSIILTIFLGFRAGLLVALIIPLVTFSSLAVFNLGGGVLHQMAIAGMVIGLGMLVDNAIVMVENIQYYIDRGMRGAEASVASVKQLSLSLGSATGTTIAAFMPMLLSYGNTGDFTRAIPVMIILSITVSYMFAILVTPAFSHLFLKASPTNKTSSLQKLGIKLSVIATQNPKKIILFAAIFITFSLYLFGFVQKDFFPDTNRNQVIVDLKYPESTNINANTIISKEISRQISQRPNIQNMATFVGNSGPVFYYNLIEKPSAPHIARVVVMMNDVNDTAALIQWIDTYIIPGYPEVEIVARRLGQGPPIESPIEIKVMAEDRKLLAKTVRDIQIILANTEGARAVRNTIGLGMLSVEFLPKDDLLNKNNMSRQEFAQGLALRTSGQVIAQYRGAIDPIDIVIQSPDNVNFPIENINDIEINSNGNVLTIDSLTTQKYKWLPASIQRLNLQRTASVLSETQENHTYADVMDNFLPQLESMSLAKGVSYQIAGSAKESGDANKSLGNALPIGIIMLLMFLLLEFNSYRKVLIILVTVPLAFAGVPIGLLLTNTPFGFTATLGILALIGIVVNNAIVLLSLITKNKQDDMTHIKAIQNAVARRTRPILLTTFTTVAGLTPLVMTKSTLWPPLAWSIISGLIVSTALSLLVVPALYQLFVKPDMET